MLIVTIEVCRSISHNQLIPEILSFIISFNNLRKAKKNTPFLQLPKLLLIFQQFTRQQVIPAYYKISFFCTLRAYQSQAHQDC